MSAVPPGSLHTTVGDAATADELRLCKIGGCCGKDTPLLPPEALLPRVSALPRWQISADQKRISTRFVARNWSEAMKFFNALSVIAEEEGHHPDISLTNYREVAVDLTTHAVGGLTMPDLVLAAKLDAIPVEYSAKWLRGDAASAYRPADGN